MTRPRYLTRALEISPGSVVRANDRWNLVIDSQVDKDYVALSLHGGKVIRVRMESALIVLGRAS